MLAANRSLDAAKYGTAMRSILKQAVGSSNWMISMNKAIALSKTLKFEEALDAMQQAFEAGGDTSHIAYDNLGNIYQDRAMYAQAIDAYPFSITLANRSNYSSIWRSLPSLTSIRRRTSNLRTCQKPMSMTRGPITDSAQPFERAEQALDMYELALKIAPKFALSHFNRAAVLAIQKEYAEAIDALQYVPEIAPKDPLQAVPNDLSFLQKDRSSKNHGFITPIVFLRHTKK